jgi:hypothetical protein
LETKTLRTKTSTTALKKTSFLPVVVPVDGISKNDWVDQWLHVRHLAGLPPLGSKRADGSILPAMPCILKSGKFTQEPLSATSAGKWLRELIQRKPRPATLEKFPVSARSRGKVKSHSLKRTPLSWIAKSGRFQPLERKVLGYHCDSSETSMFTYGRDNVAEPMRKFEALMCSISTGEFRPDETRSGHFADGGRPRREALFSQTVDNGHQVAAQESEPVHDDDVTSEDVPSTDESLCSDEDVSLSKLEPFSDRLLRLASVSVDERRYVHSRLRTLHAGHISDHCKLACGRKLHEGFRLCEESDSFVKCADCFAKRKAPQKRTREVDAPTS